MKNLYLIFFAIPLINTAQWVEMTKNPNGKGQEIIIEVAGGKKYNHPVIAIWLTNTDGKFIQTLYVSQSVGKGVYERGKVEDNRWVPGEKRHPSTLPLWSHQRGIKERDGLYIPTTENSIPDAYTGPTPPKNFRIITRLDENYQGKGFLFFEINQPFDFNEYWHNNRFPGNRAYEVSGQPSIVYFAMIDFEQTDEEYFLQPIGHGDPTGGSGRLFTNLSTITTALQIVKYIKVQIKPKI
ncbi:MAG: hypothetical protein N2Z72_06340 [Bacteroidales bacterium]|nr:hypothetical protein [Bacteroidales bacterium]